MNSPISVLMLYFSVALMMLSNTRPNCTGPLVCKMGQLLIREKALGKLMFMCSMKVLRKNIYRKTPIFLRKLHHSGIFPQLQIRPWVYHRNSKHEVPHVLNKHAIRVHKKYTRIVLPITVLSRFQFHTSWISDSCRSKKKVINKNGCY